MKKEISIVTNSFINWHVAKKTEVIKKIFKKYLYSGCRFIDIACGDGDALVLANECEPSSEIWGVDINEKFLEKAHRKARNAILIQGDLTRLDEVDGLPINSFDIAHEFGATCMVYNWRLILPQYLRLLRSGGILLWELPPKWSMAHLMYLFTFAPKITENDTKIKRLLKSILPWKYTFLSYKHVKDILRRNACEVVERIPIWYLYVRGFLSIFLGFLCLIFGYRIFYILENLVALCYPICSGYYLIIRKK
jgi:ubiquinone/menaquinone biosynthesis C-methylase UbiE